MKPFRYLPAASLEEHAAAAYYLNISPRLGGGFYDYIGALLQEIQLHHATFRMFSPPYRRHFHPTGMFPFEVIYLDRPDEILIVAIRQFRQHPDEWKERTP